MRSRPNNLIGSEQGFTMVELMVSMTIASVTMLMTLDIGQRMSTAYRAQQRVTEMQQTLTTGVELITYDLRMAGHQIPRGFVRADGKVILPIRVINGYAGESPTYATDSLPASSLTDGSSRFTRAAGPTAPDTLMMYYAMPTAFARVTTMPVSGPIYSLSVDDTSRLAVGPAVIVFPMMEDNEINQNDAKTPNHLACLVKINSIYQTGTTGILSLELGANGKWYSSADNGHCSTVRATHLAKSSNNVNPTDTMIFQMVGVGYQLIYDKDGRTTLRRCEGGQLTANNDTPQGMTCDWTTLVDNAVDMQIAVRTFDKLNTVDHDNDGDPARNWASGENLETLTGPVDITAVANWPRITQLSLTLVTRIKSNDTDARTSPKIMDGTQAGNNHLGDNPGMLLEGVPDANRPAVLRGGNRYRVRTLKIDTRNTGVGL